MCLALSNFSIEATGETSFWPAAYKSLLAVTEEVSAILLNNVVY